MSAGRSRGGQVLTVQVQGQELRTHPLAGLTLVAEDGTQWVIRPSEQYPTRLEVLLVPGTGPAGESDVSVRAVASNRFTLEAVGW